MKNFSLEDRLLIGKRLFRTHRSYILNQNEIENIEPWYKNSYHVKIKNLGTDFYISERYAARLKKRFSF